MHDYASRDDVSKDLLIPKPNWSSHNTKLDLQNLKNPLHIFASGRLSILKVKLFLTLGIWKLASWK